MKERQIDCVLNEQLFRNNKEVGGPNRIFRVSFHSHNYYFICYFLHFVSFCCSVLLLLLLLLMCDVDACYFW